MKDRDPRLKYLNQTQLLQGVAQVDDFRLSQGEALFLLTLAAFTVRTFPSREYYPHPGNQILMAACRVTTRKGVNYLANQLVAKNLIEIVQVGNGRGRATVYRIRTEDPRFPWPKKKEKPGSLNFPVTETNPEAQTSHFQKEKPGSTEPETRKLQPGNPEVNTRKPGSSDFHTDTRTDTEAEAEGESPNGSPAAASTEDLKYAFQFLHAEPYGPEPFRLIWTQEFDAAWDTQPPEEKHRGFLPRFADAMERTITRTQSLNLKVPRAFFIAKREIEKEEAIFRELFRAG